MENIRLGIVGVGGMGLNHAQTVHSGQVPGLVLAAVCDLDAGRLTKAKQMGGEGVRAFDSAGALFAAKCVDAVLIATPHYFHPPLAIEALKQGLHVLIEKPAGVYTRQVREMNEVAAKSGRVFGIMYNQRTKPVHQRLRQLIQSGELGTLRRATWTITDWFRPQSYYDSGSWRATWAGEGGGVLINQCPHNIDLWQWFFGMPQRVRGFCGFGRMHDIEVEDDVAAIFEYGDGMNGTFITSTGMSPGSNRLEINCDRGKVVMENNKLTFYRTVMTIPEFNRTFKGGFGDPEHWVCDIPVPAPSPEHLWILKNWAQAIQDGRALLAPGAEGIACVELINAMLMSTWTDGWVNLPVDEQRYFELLEERCKTSRYHGTQGRSGSVMDVTGTF
ncbi:MAG: Gfo/Idh/MocA family oxidoreductase [bacterium]